MRKSDLVIQILQMSDEQDRILSFQDLKISEERYDAIKIMMVNGNLIAGAQGKETITLSGIMFLKNGIFIPTK